MKLHVVGLLLLLLATSLTAAACECMTSEFSAKTALRGDYIALVKVLRVARYQRGPNKYADLPYYTAEIRELKRYKGSARREVVVMGGLAELGGVTSCDMGIDVGEEWLLFGTKEETVFIYPCDYTSLFRARDGFQDLHYQKVQAKLAILDSLTNQPAKKAKLAAGLLVTHYPNKAVQKSENLRAGVLHGAATYFYPNGQLYGKMNYANGQLDGRETWYTPKGVLESKATYRQGIRVDTAIWYLAMARGPLPLARHIYDNAGRIIKSQQFSMWPTGHHISQETEYEPDISKETYRYYFPNGQLRSLGYTVKNKAWGTYTEFDEQGTITRQWQYDESGRVIKPSTK